MSVTRSPFHVAETVSGSTRGRPSAGISGRSTISGKTKAFVLIDQDEGYASWYHLNSRMAYTRTLQQYERAFTGL
ncbi:MAG: hypothetical protein PHS50_13920, partial [Kiritimatiellae bacterium]|nr:hypothetical protein [Kiritimatiellia bacterium]